MSATIRRVLWVRALRAFADGYVSLVLPVYLLSLGLTAFQVGVIATATLLGSAALSLGVGMVAHRAGYRTLLLAATGLMAATGFLFAAASDFWPLTIIAVVGTLNPSSGDVSVFLPLEQSLLAHTVEDAKRTSIFARYSLVGALVGALGALFAGAPDFAVKLAHVEPKMALQAMFVLYGLIGLVSAFVYRRLPTSQAGETRTPPAPLGKSRRIVFTLAALFSLDAFGGGFVVQSMLALWLFERFDLSTAVAGTIFFWSGVFSAFSYLVAVRIAKRIGLVNTMVFTHLPANLMLVAMPFVPDLAWVIVLLLARGALANGRADARLVCHGGGDARGAAGSGEHYVGAAQPCVCSESAARRRDARRFDFRLAAAHRRPDQNRLRPVAARHVSRGASAGRGESRRVITGSPPATETQSRAGPRRTRPRR